MKITKKMLNDRQKEFKSIKETLYKNNLDVLTIRMTRKKALGTWTPQDEKDYNTAYQKCSELIKEQELIILPTNIEIVTDEEYAKMEEEERKKREEEEKLRLLEEQQKNSLLEQIEEVNNGEQ